MNKVSQLYIPSLCLGSQNTECSLWTPGAVLGPPGEDLRSEVPWLRVKLIGSTRVYTGAT